ncbi:hypothetical protein [Natronoflexus pectinivorans]|uniref:Rieske domain-containing protein n=1 Tax=Natronoflexus pectinivorans TaxID=682526 RepID=A0A4R2GN52_9BACT|nr:hypothetical protein [Natronoflexus pectinivorans]TCO10724.1 hypothetical protein EV194_101356 [Natronoflexus pectinivorans]
MIRLIFILVTVFFFFGCKTEKDPVPNVRFSITIDVGMPDFMEEIFYIPLHYRSGYSDDFGRPGISGLIIFRAGTDFIAYERYCPYSQSTRCAVILDETQFYGICPCCDSEFLLNTFEPYPARAPAISGPASDSPGLKSYRSQRSGNLLRVYN